MSSYRVAVPEEQLVTLKIKLAQAEFPDEARYFRQHELLSNNTNVDQLEEAGWDYGAPLADIKRLAQHWKTSFDW